MVEHRFPARRVVHRPRAQVPLPQCVVRAAHREGVALLAFAHRLLGLAPALRFAGSLLLVALERVANLDEAAGEPADLVVARVDPRGQVALRELKCELGQLDHGPSHPVLGGGKDRERQEPGPGRDHGDIVGAIGRQRDARDREQQNDLEGDAHGPVR